MKRVGSVLVFAVALVMFWAAGVIAATEERRYDAVVVGAGISGLAATWELVQGGLNVAVIEMSPYCGGTGLVSEGAICIVGTPEQAQGGEPDSPRIAFQDFMHYGRDENGPGPNIEWVRYYIDESRREIYDWLIGLGVRFDKKVVLMPGNSVPRWHKVVGKGGGLLEPICRACQQNSHATFSLKTKAVSLLVEGGRISGVRTQRLRDGVMIDYLAPVVILATGGFQGNLDMVRKHWPKDLPFPERALIGGGSNAEGSGHEMAQAVGAQMVNMHYQLNYPTGLLNPSDPTGRRGLNAYTDESIWVNKAGRRFMRESRDTRVTFPAVLRQPGGMYWAIFDSAAREKFHVSGFSQKAVESKIFNNPLASPSVKSAPTVGELAAAAGIPPQNLEDTVRHWNEMITAGRDTDFGRIGYDRSTWSHPPKIERPPFYAVRFSPLTRKSMGGVAIDRSCRVVDASGQPIPGLYAVGELTGLAGVNGMASVEGTFLGASILTGRVAGRAATAEVTAKKKP